MEVDVLVVAIIEVPRPVLPLLGDIPWIVSGITWSLMEET